MRSLRSAPGARLEGWPRVQLLCPSFETLASQAPQDEESKLRLRPEERLLSRVSKDEDAAGLRVRHGARAPPHHEGQNPGFPFCQKRFMVPRDLATGKVELSINIKGLAVA